MKLRNFDFSRKIFYHPDRVAELKAGGRPFPVTVEVDLTNRCNHNCSFCFYAEHLNTDNSELPTPVILKALEEMADLGTRGVSFTGGGEPMLHRDFSEILSKARSFGLDCGLITNGSAITERNAHILTDNLNWIRISVAGGDAESYSKVQGKDHFDRVINNIKLLQRFKKDRDKPINIGVRMLVTPENILTVEGLANILGTIGINYLQIAPDQFLDTEQDFWHTDHSQKIFQNAEQTLSNSKTELLTSGYVWHQDQIDVPQRCYAHFFQIAILAEGHVTYCKNARGDQKFYVGNINEQSIQEIWNNEKNLQLEQWVKSSNCGLYCKHIQMNLALEEALHPEFDMSPSFVG